MLENDIEYESDYQHCPQCGAKIWYLNVRVAPTTRLTCYHCGASFAVDRPALSDAQKADGNVR